MSALKSFLLSKGLDDYAKIQDDFKCFTIYEDGDRLGIWNAIILINILFPLNRRLHMWFGDLALPEEMEGMLTKGMNERRMDFDHNSPCWAFCSDELK